eukprot:m.117088 g.117088  ORF g.117088 m.117088 type:complete len:404 (+) comp10939_c0_seq3:272-1483(+)
MSRLVDLVFLTVVYMACLWWFSTEDPVRLRKRGHLLTAELADTSRYTLDRLGCKWVYQQQHMRSCVGGHHLPHPVVEVDGWVSAVTGHSPERVAQALLAVASDGLHLAGIHSHASRGHTATGTASPVFPGPVGHILDGMGCPLGTMPVGDDCLMRPRADVERNYIRRGGENRRTELPSHLLNRLQRFRKEYDVDTLSDTNPALASLFAGPGENVSRNNALPALNRYLESMVTNVYPEQAEAPHTTVRAVKMTVEALLPGTDMATATDAPEWPHVGGDMHPPWLRAVLRHACVHDTRRYKIIKGYSWWSAAASLPCQGPGCDTTESKVDRHEGIFYTNGVRAVSCDRVWGLRLSCVCYCISENSTKRAVCHGFVSLYGMHPCARAAPPSCRVECRPRKQSDSPL